GDKGPYVAGAEIRVWDAKQWSPLDAHEIPGDSEVRQLALSSDSRQLALACQDGTVVLVQTADWSAKSIEGRGQSALTVAFAPDNRRLAAGFDDGTVLVWDSETRERLAAIERPQSVAHASAFAPEGQRIATGARAHHPVARQYW